MKGLPLRLHGLKLGGSSTDPWLPFMLVVLKTNNVLTNAIGIAVSELRMYLLSCLMAMLCCCLANCCCWNASCCSRRYCSSVQASTSSTCWLLLFKLNSEVKREDANWLVLEPTFCSSTTHLSAFFRRLANNSPPELKSNKTKCVKNFLRTHSHYLVAKQVFTTTTFQRFAITRFLIPSDQF